MKRAARMILAAPRDKDRDEQTPYDRYERNPMSYGYMGGDYDVEDRFRDRRGREHYDNGRYAPRNERYGETRDNHPWYNYPRSEGNEMRYSYPSRIGYDMDEAEMRRRRDKRGRFRSEMDEDDREKNPGMHYPGPYPFPPPVYEVYDRPNQIGFSAHNGGDRNGLHMIRGGAPNHEMELDEDTAQEWMENLQNEDGTKGPHWTKEQTTQLMKQKNISYNPLEFWVAMNAVYSDYCGAAKKSNVNNIDFYVNMARAFIDDKDSQPNRLARYYTYIAKH